MTHFRFQFDQDITIMKGFFPGAADCHGHGLHFNDRAVLAVPGGEHLPDETARQGHGPRDDDRAVFDGHGGGILLGEPRRHEFGLRGAARTVLAVPVGELLPDDAGHQVHGLRDADRPIRAFPGPLECGPGASVPLELDGPVSDGLAIKDMVDLAMDRHGDDAFRV